MAAAISYQPKNCNWCFRKAGHDAPLHEDLRNTRYTLIESHFIVHFDPSLTLPEFGEGTGMLRFFALLP